MTREAKHIHPGSPPPALSGPRVSRSEISMSSIAPSRELLPDPTGPAASLSAGGVGGFPMAASYENTVQKPSVSGRDTPTAKKLKRSKWNDDQVHL
jgi:hypothetical protein